MQKTLFISNKIKKFDKKIKITGDKSLSIRWVLLASQAIGKSKGYNLLMSEDVLAHPGSAWRGWQRRQRMILMLVVVLT